MTQRHKPPPPTPKPSVPATPAPTRRLQLAKDPLSAGLFRDLTQSSLTARPSSVPTMSKMQEGEMKMRVARSVDKDTLKNRPSAMVTWQMSKSHVTDETEESIAVELNTPRILELDVNRVMFGQADVRYAR
mgnify:FL=1